jgi:hypothetical protein
MKTAQNQVFKDLQGRTLKVGDRVAFASFKNLGMTVGTITKLGRVRVHVTSKLGDPNVTAHWLEEPWTEQFSGNELVKVAV